MFSEPQIWRKCDVLHEGSVKVFWSKWCVEVKGTVTSEVLDLCTCCSFHCLSSLNWKWRTWLLFATFRLMSCWEQKDAVHHSAFSCCCQRALMRADSPLVSEPLPAASAPPSPDPCCTCTNHTLTLTMPTEQRDTTREHLEPSQQKPMFRSRQNTMLNALC